MSVTQIKDAEFVQAVRDEAADSPDYRYEKVHGGCVYVANGVGSCIVGRALLKVGVPVAEVAELDDSEKAEARHALPQFGLSQLVVEWANRVQSKQDGGVYDAQGLPWGEAVKEADAGVGDPLAGAE
ncbi:hypothetical protein CH253_08365 [Rhodococcus sp. 06-156-3C]|uniref:hypothetical protein n=1 Tax=Rhodococcus sp. 06-156-3C TaxID=2022486 RepID=UPI000B9A385D|nr:hypothetical protein [Rhodococcus sp. 06-156-3C]OZD23860.1 hypothetical protein CH253_08365 [Rhodococcus sp. 06-156-3C]